MNADKAKSAELVLRRKRGDTVFDEIVVGDNETIAKLFENGQSQAVRLPEECRFNSDEVAINKVGDVVMLVPKDRKWSAFLSSLEWFSDDFMCDGREQPDTSVY